MQNVRSISVPEGNQREDMVLYFTVTRPEYSVTDLEAIGFSFR